MEHEHSLPCSKSPSDLSVTHLNAVLQYSSKIQINIFLFTTRSTQLSFSLDV